MTTTTKRTVGKKIAIFRGLFTGRTDVYGTYDPATGQARQVKEPVTKDVILAHLRGKQPYGVYVLVKDRIRAMAVDFDNDDPLVALEFATTAKHYGLPAHIERSKSKGYHVWFFFEEGGALAAKARLVALHLLAEIEEPDTEVFPKQDALDAKTFYGNFIYAPLFGALVPQGRTVFLDEADSLKPHPNQWDFLEGIQRTPESLLDEIIMVNELSPPPPTAFHEAVESEKPGQKQRTFSLPPCAQRMLKEGVTSNQRVVCFRLAVQLRKAGLPYDIAVGALKTWAQKNRPDNGKGIIREREIVSQTAWAYHRGYTSCGCDDPAIASYCDPICPIRRKRNEKKRSTLER
jgi:hypothetical protein